MARGGVHSGLGGTNATLVRFSLGGFIIYCNVEDFENFNGADWVLLDVFALSGRG